MLTGLDLQIPTWGGTLEFLVQHIFPEVKAEQFTVFNLYPFSSLSGALNVNFKTDKHYFEEKIHYFAFFWFLINKHSHPNRPLINLFK